MYKSLYTDSDYFLNFRLPKILLEPGLTGLATLYSEFLEQISSFDLRSGNNLIRPKIVGLFAVQ